MSERSGEGCESAAGRQTFTHPSTYGITRQGPGSAPTAADTRASRTSRGREGVSPPRSVSRGTPGADLTQNGAGSLGG